MNISTLSPAARLVADAQALVETLDAEQFAEEVKRDGVVLIDLREQAERKAHGAIPGAVHIPRGMLEFCADPALPVHADELTADRRILLYCARGSRSALAAMTLMTMGFPFVAHLAGGFPSWVQAGGAVDTSPAEAARWTTVLAREPAGKPDQRA
ncbi:MAG TPA: rhodanese-like domain-containing protein [Candidatus Acidoferrales bacterium]|nr:rhodanese-like domain-containing protein [Candidatus Acidoferrales bacterium]